ncbi:MAG: hypothetical protein ABIG60_00380 [Patescibacteria group bacterium]
MQENLDLFKNQDSESCGVDEESDEKLEKEKWMSKKEGKKLTLAHTEEGLEIYIEVDGKYIIISEGGVIGRYQLNKKDKLVLISLEGQIKESFSKKAKKKAEEVVNNITKIKNKSEDMRGAFIIRSHPDNKLN